MAELFNNYLTSRSYPASAATTQIIVPAAGSSISSNGTGSRTQESVVQLHSIYITKNISTNQSENPLDNKSFVTLTIVDTSNTNNNTNKYVLASNVIVLPHSCFYIEKTITLRKQDRLELTYTTLNGANAATISTVCSGVELY